jgi:muramoyltetrapeptide carboxypeptidase
LIAANPKIFAGCSDVTALLTYLSDATGLVTFHAPMVAGDFARPDGLDTESWLAALSSETAYQRGFSADEVQPLRPGNANGKLYGGCLSLLVASLGTPYEIRTEDTILFIEDRGEPPYRIDRMLTQLKLAGKFEGVQGIVFGEMIDCQPPADQTYSLTDVIVRILGDLDVPLAFGLRSGHVSRQSITLPFGVDTTLIVGASVELGFAAAVGSEPAEARVRIR